MASTNRARCAAWSLVIGCAALVGCAAEPQADVSPTAVKEAPGEAVPKPTIEAEAHDDTEENPGFDQGELDERLRHAAWPTMSPLLSSLSPGAQM